MCPGRGPPDDAPPLVEDIFLRQRELVMGNTAPTGHVDRDLEKACQKEKYLVEEVAPCGVRADRGLSLAL